MLFEVRSYVLWFVSMIGSLCAFDGQSQTLSEIQEAYQPDMSKGLIYISKNHLNLTLYSNNDSALLSYPIACGRIIGPKKHKGDNKTPEGLFKLLTIENSSSWGHDFHDGNGFIKNAYGPWFMRLQTGFSGIGIHGTHAPESIGTRASEGCIRVENGNLDILRSFVVEGMTVIIGPEDGKLYPGMGKKLPSLLASDDMEMRQNGKASKQRIAASRIEVSPEPLSELNVRQPKLTITKVPKYIIFNN